MTNNNKVETDKTESNDKDNNADSLKIRRHTLTRTIQRLHKYEYLRHKKIKKRDRITKPKITTNLT